MSTENRDGRGGRRGPAPDEEGPTGVPTDDSTGCSIADLATSGGVRG